MDDDIKVCNELCFFYAVSSKVDYCFAHPSADSDFPKCYFPVKSGSLCMYGFDEEKVWSLRGFVSGDLEEKAILH